MSRPDGSPGLFGWIGYLLAGSYFGVVLAKGEVISWFRIQEMFRFQSFHMYGVIGSAVAVAAVSLLILKRAGGDGAKRLEIEDKARTPLNRRYWIGGTCFGLGWGLLGACPGPIYTLIGSGVTVGVVALAAALAGTLAYAALRQRLPH